MILVILGIAILMTALGLVWGKLDDWDNIVPYFLVGFGICGVLVTSGFAIDFSYRVSTAKVVDEKIEMYSTENGKIETQIAGVVQQYQEYEQETFDKVAPKDAMTLVTLYPELKSDELVQKQIAVYVENNEKIKELKEEKINGSVNRWWLYFGG